jgi:isopenicillin N synthase-like dioxygenase
MPAPDTLKKESDAYGKALETQLKKQSEAVIEEARIQKQMLEEEGKREIAAFQLQVEEKLKLNMMNVDKEAQMQLMGLQEAAINRKTVREEEAAVMAAGYVRAKAMEEQANRSKDVRKQFAAAEARLTAEYQAVMKAGSKAVITPANPMVPEVVMAPAYAAPAYAAPNYAYAAPAMVMPQQYA